MTTPFEDERLSGINSVLTPPTAEKDENRNLASFFTISALFVVAARDCGIRSR